MVHSGYFSLNTFNIFYLIMMMTDDDEAGRDRRKSEEIFPVRKCGKITINLNK